MQIRQIDWIPGGRYTTPRGERKIRLPYATFKLKDRGKLKVELDVSRPGRDWFRVEMTTHYRVRRRGAFTGRAEVFVSKGWVDHMTLGSILDVMEAVQTPRTGPRDGSGRPFESYVASRVFAMEVS